jgi:hypothetical protein
MRACGSKNGVYRPVRTIFLPFAIADFQYLILSFLFEFPDLKQYRTIGAALLVSDGYIQCCVGRLAPVYDNMLDHMDGRLAQVVELFSESRSRHKIDYNAANNGVCLAVIVDNLVPGDRVINTVLQGIDLESSSDEN